MSSDPYCVCAVHGRGSSTFKTPTVANDLSPRWDVCARITDFHYGDSLVFTVWDKDFGKADDALGQVSLPSEKIIPYGFDEWLVLDGTGAKGVVSKADDISSIRVTAKVLRKFPQEQTRHEEPVVQPVRNTSKEGSRSPGLHSPYSANHEKNGDEDAGQALKEEDSSKEIAQPQRTRFQRLQAFFISEKFELFLAGLLCLNICSMALELQYDGWEIGYLLDYGFYRSSSHDRFAWGNEFLFYLDMVFSVIFTIDVTLRISILQGMFWRGGISNYIDLLVVVLSWTVYILAENFPVKPMILRLIRFGKLVRALKVVRISQSLESLAFLMSCLRASGTVLVWTMSLLACIQCIAALFASNMLHFFLVDEDYDVEVRRAVFRYYGTFSGSFLTMFVTEWWTLFFLLYRCLVGFAVLNVVNAVFVQSTLKVAHADEELQFEAKQKAQRNLMNKLQNMFLALDTSGDGLLSWEEFNEAISSPKMAFWMSQLELESSDLKSLFTLLDGGDGLISVNEFMEGATRLRGPAKSIDVAKLLMLCTKTEKTLKGIVRAVKPLVDNEGGSQAGSAFGGPGLLRKRTLDTLGSRNT
ncbi:scn4aa [Symbiodinium sp. CCMP2456]|nr:scn4aa [Symbiodinium sp. CCMP2456]